MSCEQVTFFVAVLVLDERASAKIQTEKIEDKQTAGVGETSNISTNSQKTSREYWEKYVNVISTPHGMLVVLVMTAGFTAFNAWALTNLTNNFDQADIAPDDS